MALPSGRYGVNRKNVDFAGNLRKVAPGTTSYVGAVNCSKTTGFKIEDGKIVEGTSAEYLHFSSSGLSNDYVGSVLTLAVNQTGALYYASAITQGTELTKLYDIVNGNPVPELKITQAMVGKYLILKTDATQSTRAIYVIQI